MELQHAVFNERHEFTGGARELSTYRPAVLARLAEFPGGQEPVQGGVFRVDGQDYKAKAPTRDGQGGILFPLTKM